ncbi:MAG: SDR family oxidoreductase [Bacteroidetes bacterium]|nr:SDR family oxidoreductase [Bacteroidota bacterium]
MKYDFNELKGKVCAITGGAGVIGTSLAKGLVDAGINVAILDLNKEAAEKVANEIGKVDGVKVIGIEANVLNKESLIRAHEEIKSQLGEIDFLINGAGGNSPKATTGQEVINDDNISKLSETFFGLDVEGFQKVFDLNFIGTLLPSMVFGEGMVVRKKGVILNISSMNSYRPLTKIPAYSAAKASINNFTEWLAVHFAGMNVRVNAIAPGFFLTNQNRFLLLDAETQELTPRGNKIISNTPMGKFGEPEDLIGATLFLLSDMSSFMTGTIIPVDGGFNAYSGV